MLISQGKFCIFFSNWLVGGLTTLALVLPVWPFFTARLARLRAPVA